MMVQVGGNVATIQGLQSSSFLKKDFILNFTYNNDIDIQHNLTRFYEESLSRKTIPCEFEEKEVKLSSLFSLCQYYFYLCLSNFTWPSSPCVSSVFSWGSPHCMTTSLLVFSSKHPTIGLGSTPIQ